MAWSKRLVSVFDRAKARITRIPLKFWLTSSFSSSKRIWTFLYNGTVLLMIQNKMIQKSGSTHKKIKPACQSMTNAMITEPILKKGALTTKRINIANATCIWLISLVIRVINVSVPNRFNSLWDNKLIFFINVLRNSVPKP